MKIPKLLMPRKRFTNKVTKGLIHATFICMIIGLVSLVGLYMAYSKDLPSANAIANWKPAEATRIYDSKGNLLYEVYGSERRVMVPSDALSPYLKEATVATEDKRFYEHNGIDAKGIIRAAVNNIRPGKGTEGGSTITQQLAKNAYLSSKRTLTRKIQEVILAEKLEHHYSKDEILTLYLNEVGYGSNLYGAEAAANTYFGKSAKDLSIDEAAMLAAMPKSPTMLSPYAANTDKLLARRNYVIDQMVAMNYIKKDEADKAKSTKIAVKSKQENITAPHFVMYVRQQLVDKYGEEEVGRGGFQVTTSLDPDLQHTAEDIVSHSDAVFKRSGASNAALVALDPKSGHILAMVGSRNYFDTGNKGNVNAALSVRPPGSAFKPVVYATGFDKGSWAPGSTVFDVQTNFGDKKEYIPNNYDGKFHGAVSIRQALGNSFNVPAVKMVGLMGPDKVIDEAKTIGITTLNDTNKYGLSLAIGGGNTKLLELTGAYDAFANQGKFAAPVAITKITQNGKTLLEDKPEPKQVYRPEVAYEISSILSDNSARQIEFGTHSQLIINGHTVAAKTGTSQDFRDALTLGYTPSLVAGVWVGNNDYSPMHTGSAGAMAAAPLWNSFMTQALKDKPDEGFQQPDSLKKVTVDALSGTLPTDASHQTREDIFASWQMPSAQTAVNVYTIYGCDGQVKSVQKAYILHSEKPDNPAWEKPVQDWLRSNGFYSTQTADAHETCTPSPAPDVALDPGLSPDTTINASVPIATPPPAPILPPVPTPEPLPSLDLPPIPTPRPFPSPGHNRKNSTPPGDLAPLDN